MSTTEIAKPKQPTLLQTISGDTFKNQLALALPRHLTPDRFARIAITAMRKVPKLMQCTPESVLNCLLQLSQYGLEPDGRRAHLIPYGQECTMILDYKGIAELALRSGLVSTLHADVVHRGDIFEYSLGKVIKHTPWFLRCDKDRPEKEGEVFAVYAFCENKDGTTSSAVLSYDEVESVRKRSKAGNNGPWRTDWNEMAKKTAFRRLSKWLVLSPEFRDAIAHDEEVEIIETTATPAIKISDLVGPDDSANESHQENEINDSGESETGSRLDMCLQILDDAATSDSKTFSYLGKNDAGHVQYKVGQKTLTIGDGAAGEGPIDTTEPDSVEQVKNEIHAAAKKR